jgi:hypothetical protein
MKISSQLANNFDYCSAEILYLKVFLCVLYASAVRYPETCVSRESFQAQ